MTNFTMIENELFNYDISGQAFKLYCLLKSYCFNGKTTCYPSQKTLADRLNRSVRTIQRSLKELVKTGLIKIKRRGSISNIYELIGISKNATSIHTSLNKILEKKTSQKSNLTYSNKKEDLFNNYAQRNYDFEKLENALLGNSPIPENIYELLK
ncbi:helix-turn-helix domain-containing protein [Clostridium ganghwense]|uniref:Helix-turn-helix domain-containing protein n=1 Tax=Clostridium ganghwense TaxID=312089 RepID=A0ABT4CME4_9CLOT|nr:helix-turn-helix domain-containing protein [Clostridium ganghwense]MCY6370219.1 helix-turn-helix domain-containing protein [Clostridium ganghwense]